MMKWMRYVVYGAIVLFLVVALAGCGWMDQLRSFKDDNQTENGTPEQSGQTQQTPSIVEQQLGLAGDSQDPENQTPDDQTGTDVNATTPGTGDTTEPSTDQETTDVLLYFVSADTNSLEAEVRAIPKEEGLARATVNQLLSGPREEDLVAAIPSSVSLRDIDVSNGVCTVDLSADVATLASIPETDQVLALYSLVNTLTQFDTVDYVQVLLNGQQLSDFGGVDASQALAPQDL